MRKETEAVIAEIEKALVGKRSVIEKVMMAILAEGHILLDDVPGVGKTTLAVAISRAMGLSYRRIQFTPDVLPSDIVGFSMYDRESGTFRYVPGVVNDANLVLGDEINRTGSKTQSAFLEAMEEGSVTVDGESHGLKKPFCVIATQNQVGTAGTQPLPQAQLDRFLVRLTIGYPDMESEMDILRGHRTANPVESVRRAADTGMLIDMQQAVSRVSLSDEMISYIARLSAASRENENIELGLSPRGSIAVSRMARACAFLRGRDFVIPEDVREVFSDVAAHRLIISQKGRLAKLRGSDAAAELIKTVPLPNRPK